MPLALRQQLGLHSGARLDVHLVDGTIMLRPTQGTRAPTDREAAVEPPAVTSAPTPSLETALPQKRPRGRPRKVPTLERPAEPMLADGEDYLPHLSASLDGRGRSASKRSSPSPRRGLGQGRRRQLWKLRPKAELYGEKALRLYRPYPDVPEHSRKGWDHEREERRPFRNVEVRKLGARRRHNRAQRGINPTG